MQKMCAPLLLACVACSQDPASLAAVVPAEPAAVTASAAAANTATATGATPSQERLVIREARIHLRSKEPRKVAARATRIAAGAGGFVLESTLLANEGTAHQVELELRVSHTRLEEVLGELRALGTVLEESTTGQDITEEFVDVSARLATQRVLEQRLLTLAHGSAKLKDLLAVEQELARVRGEIESKTGRLRYLEGRARMASIHLVVAAPDQPITQATQSVASRFANAASRAAEISVTLAELCIMALGIAIPLVVLGTVVTMGVRLRRRLRRGGR